MRIPKVPAQWIARLVPMWVGRYLHRVGLYLQDIAHERYLMTTQEKRDKFNTYKRTHRC